MLSASAGPSINIASLFLRSRRGFWFAPNPFWRILTLACCKPRIRLTAEPGDLLVGLAGAGRDNAVVYVACVKEKLTFREYWSDPRFLAKRPDMNAAAIAKRCGDNIYGPGGPGTFRQLPSGHSNGIEEDLGNKAHDVGGRFVLTSADFSYVGVEAIPLPDRFSSLIVGRAHRCHFSDELVTEFDAWRKSLPVVYRVDLEDGRKTTLHESRIREVDPQSQGLRQRPSSTRLNVTATNSRPPSEMRSPDSASGNEPILNRHENSAHRPDFATDCCS